MSEFFFLQPRLKLKLDELQMKNKRGPYTPCIMALADVKIPHSFFFCSFELTGVAGNSIRHSEEEEKKSLLKDRRRTADLRILRSDL